jgi:transcriptional regulator with XRE-family HTH domain
MTLREWRIGKELRYTDVADMLGLKGSSRGNMIRRWETGERCPDWETAQKIRIITHGKVTPEDWAEQIAPRASVERLLALRVPPSGRIAA